MARATSVDLLCFERMDAMTCERFFFERKSAIDSAMHSIDLGDFVPKFLDKPNALTFFVIQV